jgi:hypothetical protein
MKGLAHRWKICIANTIVIEKRLLYKRKTWIDQKDMLLKEVVESDLSSVSGMPTMIQHF